MRVTLRNVVRVWPLRITEQEAGNKALGIRTLSPAELEAMRFNGPGPHGGDAVVTVLTWQRPLWGYCAWVQVHACTGSVLTEPHF